MTFIIGRPGKPAMKNKLEHQPKTVTCGQAFSWWCGCDHFNITFKEEISFGEAKCGGCGLKSKLDLENVLGVTPPAPKRKVDTKECGIRVFHSEAF